jgi:hypothetical protein
MNLWKHLSRRPVMPRVLTCQTWIALDGKDQVVDNAILFLAGGWRSCLVGLGTGMSDLPAVLQPQW